MFKAAPWRGRALGVLAAPGLRRRPRLRAHDGVRPATGQPGCADPAGQTQRSINSAQLLTYVLTNFATVEEVKRCLPQVLVNGAQIQAFGGPLPIHMTLHDRSGKSLSVEYINDPPFPYHLAAAGNYANLSAMPPAELTVNGLKLPPASTGGGLHG